MEEIETLTRSGRVMLRSSEKLTSDLIVQIEIYMAAVYISCHSSRKGSVYLLRCFIQIYVPA